MDKRQKNFYITSNKSSFLQGWPTKRSGKSITKMLNGFMKKATLGNHGTVNTIQ